jgi:segregation and condensation protein B
MATLKAVVEALLFASQKPLSQKEIRRVLLAAGEQFEEGPESALARTTEAEILEALCQLQREYPELGRAFELVEQVSGWVLVSRTEYQFWVRQLFPEMRPNRLSTPALETLAIVAYRQPITKAGVEAIRGVTVDGVLQKLLDAGLVRIIGRAEIPGRPLLYGSTQHFLEHFGLKNLDELPNASELRKIPLPKAGAPAEPLPPPRVEPSDPPDSEPENSENGEVEKVPGTDSKAN